VVLLLTCPTVQASAQEQAEFATEPVLADYLAWAEDHNPAVARAVGRSDALRHRAGGAGALPDLKFGWGEMIVPVETRVGPQQRVLSLSQNIPWFGTLGLKEEVAGKQADAALVGVRGQLLRVRHEIRAAWFDLAHLQGEISIINGNLALARQAETATRSSYESGAGSFGDVLAAQIEVEKLAASLAGLKDRIRPVTSRLNQATGLPQDHPTPQVEKEALNQAGFVLPPVTIIRTILEDRNPELAALRLEMEGRRQSLNLAGKAGYPDLTLGVDYIMTGQAANEGIPDSGKDPVIARLGVSIPLWGGKAGAEKKASAGWLAATSADLTDTRRQLNTRLDNALYEWREAARNVELYGTVLLSSGRQALEVTSARYRSGQASYVDLVTSRNTLLGLELAHLGAAVDLSHALNDLATLLGVSITELRASGAAAEFTADPRNGQSE
jgi:outer membrane protein TolC